MTPETQEAVDELKRAGFACMMEIMNREPRPKTDREQLKRFEEALMAQASYKERAARIVTEAANLAPPDPPVIRDDGEAYLY